MLTLSRKEEKNKIMKISRSKIKQVNRFMYFRSVVQKNGEIQREINERIRSTSQSHHLIKSIWNKDVTNSMVPKPEGSSPHSQQQADDPYPETGESTPHPPPQSPYGPF
jgi:hypothetical protein